MMGEDPSSKNWSIPNSEIGAKSHRSRSAGTLAIIRDGSRKCDSSILIQIGAKICVFRLGVNVHVAALCVFHSKREWGDVVFNFRLISPGFSFHPFCIVDRKFRTARLNGGTSGGWRGVYARGGTSARGVIGIYTRVLLRTTPLLHEAYPVIALFF